MKKISTLIAGLTMLTTTACAGAQTTTVQASVTQVQPLVTTVTNMELQEMCEIVRVPIYENRRSSATTGEALTGAIVGGVIGNQFGSGSGKDAMTVLGAIVGADVVNKRGNNYQVVTGYRNEEQCNVVRTPTKRAVNQGYEVYYEWNGLRSSVITDTRYSVGDTILVRVSLN